MKQSFSFHLNVLLGTIRVLDYNAFLQRVYIVLLSSGIQSCMREICCALILLPLKLTFSPCLEACNQISLSCEFWNFIRCVFYFILLFLPDAICAFSIKVFVYFSTQRFSFLLYFCFPRSVYLSISETMHLPLTSPGPPCLSFYSLFSPSCVVKIISPLFVLND